MFYCYRDGRRMSMRSMRLSVRAALVKPLKRLTRK